MPEPSSTGAPSPARYATARRMAPWLPIALVAVACPPAIPRVDVATPLGTTTTEDGSCVDLVVTLASRPKGYVTVAAESSDTTEGEVSPAVRFSAASWPRPQSIHVCGVDDALDDGDIPYDVTLHARSAGSPDEPPLLVTTLHFVNTDDESPTFQAIGDLPGGDFASFVTDTDATGETVVGWSVDGVGDQAVRWTSATGLVGLGGPSSRAEDVSPDGSLVSGSVVEASYQGGRAGVLWRGESPFEFLPGPVLGGGSILFWFVDASVVLDDGSVWGTCIQYAAYGAAIACRWDGPGLIAILPAAHVYSADAEHHWGGVADPYRLGPFIGPAIYDGTPLPFPSDTYCSPLGECRAEVRDFATGGAVIVGTANLPAEGPPPPMAVPHDATAFAYTAAEGMLRLPDLAGDGEVSGALAITRDGHAIGGYATDASGREAVVWIDRLPVPLELLFAEAGGALPDGWQLRDVRAFSDDGRVVVGNATNPEGNSEGYRLVFPSALTAGTSMSTATASPVR